MKKHQERALNAFAALESLPDSMLLEAEQALIAAEGGVIAPVKKSGGRVARFFGSGWGAAVIAGLVALGVLVFVIRAGREAPVYEPPMTPPGSTIQMSTEGAPFTLAMEQADYRAGDSRITVILTARRKGKSLSVMSGAWHLERVTASGAESVSISFTEEAMISAKPGRDEYATLIKSINIEEPLSPGHYRLHATEFDGEKYVSVAWCSFTVGDPSGESGRDPSGDYSPAAEQPYTVTVADHIPYGTLGLGIQVTATEAGAILVPHRCYRIVKLIGPANGPDAGQMQTSEAVEVHPETSEDYAVYRDSVTLTNSGEWLPGLYRLYAMNYDNQYIDYCDFVITGEHSRSFEMFLNETVITTQNTLLSAKIIPHEKGMPFGGGNQWALYRVEGESRTLIGSRATEEAFEPPEVAPDEFCEVSRTVSILDLTGGETLPAGWYELIYDPNGHAVTLPFTVMRPAEASFETAFPGFRISLPESAYLYDKTDGFVTNRGSEDPGPPEIITDESLPATRTLTVDGQELTLTYWHTESRNSPSDTDHYIYTQPGHAEGEWSILAIYPRGSDQLSRIHYRCRDGFLLKGLPTTRNAAKEVADARVRELMGSLPRSSDYLYDADSKTHTVTYHSTSSLIRTATVSIYKLSNADTVQIIVSLPRYDEGEIQTDVGAFNTSLLTDSLEDYLTRYYADSPVTFEGLEEGVYATAGPRFHYTATVTVEGRRQSVSVQVYQIDQPTG